MTVRSIPVDEIDVQPGHNYREEKDMITEDLEQSMATLGQLQAIQVMVSGDRYLLNAGERRLRAARKLGWERIDALVLDGMDSVDMELASIDENIVRRQLAGASLDRALARRKDLYLQKYPETAQYVAGGRARNGAEDGEERPKSFTEDTAEKTGKSPRTVERSVRRAERLSPSTMRAYEAGDINQSQADILASLPHEEQESLLPDVVGKSVDDTRKLVSGEFKESGSGGSKDRRPMELLEELYMHGQKLVALLEAMMRLEDPGDEVVESVLQLRETLNDEFDTFEQRMGTRDDDDDGGGSGDPLDDFPESPPF